MRKRVILIIPITIFVVMLGLGIVSPLMPLYAKNLGANGLWLGIIFASFAFARMIFMPIVGKYSDIKGRKKFITTGLLFYAVFSLLYPLADSSLSLTIIRFFHGLVSAMVLPVAMAYMGEAAPEGKEGTVMGICNTSLFLGMGFGPFLGGLLQQELGIRSVFYVMALLSTVAFSFSFLFLPDKQFSVQAKNKITPSYWEILKNKIMKGLLLFRAIGALGRAGILSFLPLFAVKIDLNPADIGLILSCNIFLAGILQPVFGKMADKLKKHHMILFGSFLTVIALLLIPSTKNFWQLFIVCSLVGLGSAISIPAATAIIVRVGQGVGMGTSMGMFDTAMSAGMMTAPLVSGVVMDLFGLDWVFFTAGLLSLLGTMIFYYFIKSGLKARKL